MKKIVVDSSVMVKWLHQEDEGYLEQADRIIKDAQKDRIVVLAPELSKYEVGNALLIKKKLTPNEAKVLLASFYSLPIQFIAQSQDNANETYNIAHKAHITYYDASFIALAKQENAVLVTDNPKHQGKTKEITVRPLQNY